MAVHHELLAGDVLDAPLVLDEHLFVVLVA